MQYVFQVNNVKCDGCASAIREGLVEEPQVDNVDVDVGQGLVTVETVAAMDEQTLADRLKSLGYPVRGA